MKRKLATYLLLTFLITWGCWFGDALLVKLTPWTASDPIPMILFTIGGFGPTLAGCVCMDGGFSWKKLTKYLFGRKRQGLLTLVILSGLTVLMFSLASSGFIASIPQGIMPKVVVSTVVFLQAAILYGGNEELGWRGTMQPLLQEKLPVPLATLIVGCVWVLWHIPLWFIEGDSRQDMSFAFFAGFGLLLSYWLSAVYNRTSCVFPCMLYHGLVNTLMGVLYFDGKSPWFLAGTAILTALSIFLTVKNTKADRQ